METIRVGSSGPAVEDWQRVLNHSGEPVSWMNAAGEQRTWATEWNWPLDVDGRFGERTEAATEAWQAGRGLVADGIVGPKTWDAAGGNTEATPNDDSGPPIPFFEARNYTRGRAQAIRLLVVHTTESPKNEGGARATAKWFKDQPKRGEKLDGVVWGGTSAHYVVDREEIVQCVHEGDTAWHAGPVNGYSIGVEHVGRADQTPQDWNDDYSHAELLRSADLVARLAARYGIPIRRLSLDDLKAGAPGLCGHVDVTNALTGGIGHTDPGSNFPWDFYLSELQRRVTESTGVRALPLPPDEPAWVEVPYQGVTWLVAPSYIGPIGIGEAEDLAQRSGCVLPSPGLVDAIWQKADLKLDARELIRTDLAHMTDPDVLADQAKKVTSLVGDRKYTLLAGSYKDVARSADGRVGLYGWQRPDGSVIQPFYSGHAKSWKDYSQGLRLAKPAS